MEKAGLSKRNVMDLAISTNAAMTFVWGFVHCDPHPGNILVRRHPGDLPLGSADAGSWIWPWNWYRAIKPTKPRAQIVLIDHGLYIPLPREFREDYCTLWRSLFVLDVPRIESIARKWGIAVDANM